MRLVGRAIAQLFACLLVIGVALGTSCDGLAAASRPAVETAGTAPAGR